MAAVGFDLYTRLLAEAVEERKAAREGRAPELVPAGATVDLPVDAHLPDGYVPDEAQKLELYRRLARARSAGDLAAFRQEAIDRFGPLPAPALRLLEVAELRQAAEAAGIASITREEGQLVVRFGAGLGRAKAMRLLAGALLPGVGPSDLSFAANQVRLRVPRDPAAAWRLCQALVARIGSARAGDVG
jgi:transcription-repair coupling factor (superfamily II helicase)